MSGKESGMTILEVVIAITILLIGIGFVLQGNAVAYRYLGKHQLRQQMFFYAAGQMEAVLEKQGPLEDPTPPFKNFDTTITKTPTDAELSGPPPAPQGTLQKIQITVTDVYAPDVEPVSIYTYRVWVQ